jgi:hypothetical protein
MRSNSQSLSGVPPLSRKTLSAALRFRVFMLGRNSTTSAQVGRLLPTSSQAEVLPPAARRGRYNGLDWRRRLTWHAIDTHRSCSPDYLRLSDFCGRSNPHRSANLLTGISTSPRFPPSALARRLPSHLSAHARHLRSQADDEQPLTSGAGGASNFRSRPISAARDRPL